MKRRLAAIVLSALAAPAAGQSPLAQMLDVSQLARFRPVTVGMFSSYDRTGLNDDGFSGKHSYLRKEGDGLVIAELDGPGALTRIWTPTPISAPIEFYLDGERTPRISLPFDRVFEGTHPPFTGAGVGRGVGGYWSYVPIEFQRSIKVVVRAPRLQFYQINYALYPRRTRIGQEPAPNPLPAASSEMSGEVTLLPGSTETLFHFSRPGRIARLEIGPASAFAGDERAVLIRMSWDGARVPAVEVPVGELFAYTFGQPAARSRLLGTLDGTNYLALPMPWSRSARIELVDRRTAGPPLNIRSRVTLGPGRAADEGYFHVRWNRETRVRRGIPFDMLKADGRGHVVGFALQVQGAKPGDTGFFEGDDVVAIDGRIAIHGTGTEDAFNGGWYGLPGRWNGRGSFPLSGALDYSRQLARTGGYRLLLGDAYAFDRAVHFTIEHGPEHNREDGDYAGTTFFYLDRPEGLKTAEPERRVIRAKAFRVGTNPLAGLDTLIYASLTPGGRDLADGWVPTARLARTFGADKLVFDDDWGPPLLSLRVDVPRSGLYAIHVDALKGPNAAKLQLRDSNFQPVGSPTDFYAPAEGRSGFVKIGEVRLSEGQDLVHLTIPERNPASKGAEVSIIEVEGRLIGD